MNALLQNWSAVLDAGAQLAGGKGWNLARLDRYGLPVPAGAVLTIEAERAWREASGLGERLLAACAELDRLEAARAALLRTPLPQTLISTLDTFLTARGWDGIALAVRSSAPQEDAAGTSFAGIHHSCLNVTGTSALSEAIRMVWASLWTPAAAAYRQRAGIAHAEAGMAVVIMPLLPAVASGIGFTCDPRDGRDDRVLLHALPGLGEALVGGQSEGDEWLFDEDPLDDSLRLLDKRLGRKQLQTVALAAGGTANRALDAPSNARPSLDDDTALRVAETLRDAAGALDFAAPRFDLEWVWDGHQVWVVQVRPVTVSARNTYPALQEQPDIWSRGNTCEVMPEPESALDWAHSRKLVDALLTPGYALSGYALRPGVTRAGLFHGRLYLNVALMQWEAWDAIGLPPAALNELMGGHQPEIRVQPPTWRERLARFGRILRYLRGVPAVRRAGLQRIEAICAETRAARTAALPDDDAGLLELTLTLGRRARATGPLGLLQGSGGATLARLVQTIEQKLPGEGATLAAALLAGGEASVTAAQGYALVELAQLAATEPAVRDWLVAPDRGEDWQSLPADSRFRTAFADFLERYGHRGVYETYCRNPRWREHPAYLLDLLPGLASTDLQALRARQTQAAQAAWQRLRTAVACWQRPLLKMMIRQAGVETRQREAARSALIAMLEPGRRALLAAGQRLQARGALEHAEDIFELLLHEVVGALRGRIPAGGLRARTSDRRRLREAQASWEPPHLLSVAGRAVTALAEASTINPHAERLHGVAVGCGRARGVARLVRTPQQGTRLAAGEILVAPSTDPCWTPLFLRAGALVMETGGYMSHGAIVAREFGIPAVANLHGIFEALRDGERLEVDGDRGEIVRMTG